MSEADTRHDAPITQDSHVAPGEGVNRIGAIENRGIDFIPEVERTSRPVNLFWVFFGAQWCYATFILGGLLIAFGLSWWSAVTATLVGTAVGSAIFCGMAFFGPRTGTNGTLSSASVFGIRGRYVGSLISQAIDVVFNILSLWGGGVALMFAADRLFGLPTGDGALAVWMVLLAAGVTVLGVLGHATLVATLRFVAAANVLVMAILIALKAGDFETSVGIPHLLGGFTATWLLGVTVAAVNPLSYGAVVADYSRYMPSDSDLRELAKYAFLGVFLGTAGGYLAGAFLTLTFADAATPFTQGLVEVSPIVFLVPLILIGSIGNIGNLGLAMYNSSLDLQAIFWRLKRVQVAGIMAVLTVALALLLIIGIGAQDTLSALVTVVIVLVTPWIAINLIGFFEHRGRFDVVALHEYTNPKGRYWYMGGFSVRALIAWAVGVVIGLLFTANSLFTGTLAGEASGVDLSFTAGALAAALVYLLLGWLAKPIAGVPRVSDEPPAEPAERVPA